MYLRTFRRFMSTNHKKRLGPQNKNPQSATFAGSKNKLVKFATLRICDLRNLFADRPPLIVHNISYTSPLSQYSCLKMGGGTHLRLGAHCTGIVNASLYVTGKNSLNLKTVKQWQEMYMVRQYLVQPQLLGCHYVRMYALCNRYRRLVAASVISTLFDLAVTWSCNFLLVRTGQ